MVRHASIPRICGALKALRLILVIALPASLVVLWPRPLKPPALATAASPVVGQTETDAGQPDLDWYAPLWQRDLKQPPIPQNPTEPSPDPATAAGPVPTLVATFVETQGRYAHLRDQSGRLRMKAIDEVIGRYRVAAIEPGKVQLQSGATSVWIEMPRNKDR